MVVHLETIDHQNQPRDFALLVNTLEEALDAVSLIAAQATQLSTAYVVENGKWTTLPVEAFDGQNMSRPLQALEAQWRHILD